MMLLLPSLFSRGRFVVSGNDDIVVDDEDDDDIVGVGVFGGSIFVGGGDSSPQEAFFAFDCSYVIGKISSAPFFFRP